MVKANSIIIEYILLSKSAKTQKKSRWHQTSTKNAKAHDLCRCSVNDGLEGVKGAGNGKTRHRLPNLLNKYRKGHKFFQRCTSKQVKEVKRHSN